MTETGYFCIEARWERTHSTPEFFLVDEIGGSLDDAKRVAQSYLDRHVASTHMRLEWVVGVTRSKRCYYAHTEFATFRITS